MPKHALIVDDSATARMVLGRLLARHRLVVEAVASAEEALRHLEHARPDVIFMDHQMPGMDGLQALAAIKANPATATIPVMMYTSQAGEVYVGQARALGALGVLPKQVKPVEVSEILRSLRLIGETSAAEVGGSEGAVETSGAVPPGGGPPPAPGALPSPDALRELLADLFAQQQQLLRAELREAVVRSDSAVPAQSATAGPWRWVAGALAIVCLLLGTVLAVVTLNDGSEASLAPPSPTARPEADLPVAEPPRVAVGPTAVVGRDEWLVSFEWALNQDLQQPAHGPLLGDTAAALLRDLLPLLEALEWQGSVQLLTHVGRFCLVPDASGELVPAASGVPLGDCVALGLAAPEARREGLRQSLDFANALGGLTARHAPRIAIELDTFGSSAARYPYPPANDDLPAAAWNTQAARNHRLEIRLQPAAEVSP